MYLIFCESITNVTFESNSQFSREWNFLSKESLHHCNTRNRVATFREHGALKGFSSNLKPPPVTIFQRAKSTAQSSTPPRHEDYKTSRTIERKSIAPFTTTVTSSNVHSPIVQPPLPRPPLSYPNYPPRSSSSYASTCLPPCPPPPPPLFLSHALAPRVRDRELRERWYMPCSTEIK